MLPKFVSPASLAKCSFGKSNTIHIGLWSAEPINQTIYLCYISGEDEALSNLEQSTLIDENVYSTFVRSWRNISVVLLSIHITILPMYLCLFILSGGWSDR